MVTPRFKALIFASAALCMAVNAVFQARSGGLWLLSLLNVAGFSWLAYRAQRQPS